MCEEAQQEQKERSFRCGYCGHFNQLEACCVSCGAPYKETHPCGCKQCYEKKTRIEAAYKDLLLLTTNNAEKGDLYLLYSIALENWFKDGKF